MSLDPPPSPHRPAGRPPLDPGPLLPVGDSRLKSMLATLRAGLTADGLAIVSGARSRQPLRLVSAPAGAPARDDALVAWLLAQAAPVVIADLGATPAVLTSPWLTTQAARSLLAVPLRVDDAITGTLAAFSRWPGHFGETTAGAAELAAAVVGPALDWLWRAQAAENVLEIARMVNGHANVKDLLNEVCLRAARLCDGHRASLWIFDLRGRYAAVSSAHVSGRRDPELWEQFTRTWSAGRPVGEQAITQWIRERRTPLAIDDYAGSTFEEPGIVAVFGTRSLMCLPLLHEDRVVGLMTIDRTEVRPFSADEMRLAVSVAATVAPVVERARVLDETEAELRQAEAQVEIARALTSTLELRPLLRVIAEHAARACGMDRCSVFLYQDERLVPVMSRFADGRVDHALWTLFKSHEAALLERIPAAEEAVETRAPVVVDDPQNDPRVPVALRRFAGTRLMALPLMRPGKAIGVLVLEYVDHNRAIRTAQVNLGMTISSQIALALENARLLTETRSHAAALRVRNAELDSFVHTVSHDLKAPLVSIQGMAALLLEGHAADLDDEGKHYLDRIQANTARMERLLLDLLALSRIGREARPTEDVHLAELVDEALADLGDQLRGHGIKVVVGALPTVRAVRVQMEQVVRNLLSNAVKYMGDSPVRSIEVGAVRGDAADEIWVHDTGIGIAPEYHAQIFEIFQRLQEIDAEGTGVGLPIVRKIVETAGGKIWVESEHGQGATFRFTWPVAPGR